MEEKKEKDSNSFIKDAHRLARMTEKEKEIEDAKMRKKVKKDLANSPRKMQLVERPDGYQLIPQKKADKKLLLL